MLKKIAIGAAVVLLVLAAFAPDKAGKALDFLGEAAGNIVELIRS